MYKSIQQTDLFYHMIWLKLCKLKTKKSKVNVPELRQRFSLMSWDLSDSLRGSDEKPFVAQPRAATMNDGPTTASRNTEEDNSEKINNK